jgi:DNA-binding XRE family transcriptional regulator
MILVTTNLKKIRKNKGLTQRELANKANIRLTNYVYIEQGKSEPRLSTALLIAQALGEPIEILFSIKKDERKRN